MSRRAKRIITIVGCVLATVFLVSLIGNLTNGFEDLFNPSEWGAKELNPDNYIKADIYTIKDTSDPSGIDIKVNDNGLITAKGENKLESDFTVDICKVTLPAGTYTFTSGVSGTSASKYYLKAGEYTADFNNNTFVLSQETELTVSLVVRAGENINATFSPVIVSGEDEGSFYID